MYNGKCAGNTVKNSMQQYSNNRIHNNFNFLLLLLFLCFIMCLCKCGSVLLLFNLLFVFNYFDFIISNILFTQLHNAVFDSISITIFFYFFENEMTRYLTVDICAFSICISFNFIKFIQYCTM